MPPDWSQEHDDDVGLLPYFTSWLLSSFAIALLGIMTIARFSISK